MVKYNFKKITVVPTAKDFVDIIFSRTQRQTPTVIHKGYKITRIRQFYMRKVKFAQTNFHEKLSTIIEEFPRLDQIHPFYARLIDVLHEEDRYKVALGRVNTARNKISQIAKDCLKQLKYGQALYQCKTRKKDALGCMRTQLMKISEHLAYLEDVRQHLARLPSIDPYTRTLLICGCPNVGKSSFMNKVTRADVDVQPYAFTTQSLFVGHTNYKCLRYQVIDTPGILDRPLDHHNRIEMSSITALSYLPSAVLFFVDISGSCGYTIAQQSALFHNIKTVFTNKPLLIVCNKTDLMPMENISEEDRKLIEAMKSEAMKTAMGASEEAVLLTMSTLIEEGGVMSVKNAACQRLLDQRVEAKMKSKRINDHLNRFHVAMPKPRDNIERLPCIPQEVLEAKEAKEAAVRENKRKTEKDLEEENGGAGVYSASLKKNYILHNEEWKEDIMPEILDGHNVADFIDPDILQRLEELEREEGLRKGEVEEEMDGEEEELSEEQKQQLAAIRKRKAMLIQEHRLKKTVAQNRPTVARKFDKDKKYTTKRMGRELSALGLDPSSAMNRARSKSRGRKRDRSAGKEDEMDLEDNEQNKKQRVVRSALGLDPSSAMNRARSKSRGRKRDRSAGKEDAMDLDNDEQNKKQRVRSKSRAMSISRSQSRPPADEVVPGEGFKDSNQKKSAIKISNKSHKKRDKNARRGEADRVIPTLRPKHLFSGKRGKGKTDRR